MRLTGSVSFRPIRIGFLIPPNDLGLVSRIARLLTCLWGGRYNVMIPFFDTGGERWVRPYHTEGGLNVARGYVNFFEPDPLVETSPGMAERLGWQDKERISELPRIVSLDEFYTKDFRGRTEFAAGIDILEVMHHLYRQEYKYERRHKRGFVTVENGGAYFDVVGGRYPSDEMLAEILMHMSRCFRPRRTSTADTATKMIKGGICQPGMDNAIRTLKIVRSRITRRNFLRLIRPIAGDLIDYWNYRLIVRRVIPINLEWFVAHKDFIRDRIVPGCIVRFLEIHLERSSTLACILLHPYPMRRLSS